MTRRTIEVRCSNGCVQQIKFVSTEPETGGDTVEGHFDPETPDGPIAMRKAGGVWTDHDVELQLRVQALIPGQQCGVCQGDLSFALMAPEHGELLLLPAGTPLFEGPS